MNPILQGILTFNDTLDRYFIRPAVDLLLVGMLSYLLLWLADHLSERLVLVLRLKREFVFFLWKKERIRQLIADDAALMAQKIKMDDAWDKGR